MKPSVQTDEDNAHRLFLEAEAARFSGGDLPAAVIPAYAKVVAGHGSTREAAKAQFVIAMLSEQMANGEEKVAGSLDSAISAHQTTRELYPQTPYGMVSDSKLAAANIKPRSRSPSPSSAPAVPASGPTAAPATPIPGAPIAPTPPAASAIPAAPAAPGTPAAVPATGEVPATGAQAQEHYRGGPPAESTPPAAETSPAADTASAAPEGKTKEVLDSEYENVDQY
jgi:hypothetical protein